MKKVHKTSGTDDKKLQTSLKKLNVQPIQAIEEVNMFKEDGNVIHFAAPKGNYAHNYILPYTLRKKQQLTLKSPLSPRLRPLEHLRDLRQRRGQGTHRTGSRDSQPAGPRLARKSEETG